MKNLFEVCPKTGVVSLRTNELVPCISFSTSVHVIVVVELCFAFFSKWIFPFVTVLALKIPRPFYTLESSRSS